MDLKNIFDTGNPHLKRLAITQLSSYNTIQVSYEGFRVEPSLKSKSPCNNRDLYMEDLDLAKVQL
jgi:hypothetical protein